MFGLKKDVKDRDIIRELLKECAVKGKSVLDVGAGSGRLSDTLRQSGAKVVAFDSDIKQLAKSLFKNKAHPIQIRHGNIKNLPYEDNKFHTILCINLLNYLPKDNLNRSLSELFRVAGHNVIVNFNFLGLPGMKMTRTPLSLAQVNASAIANNFILRKVRRRGFTSSELFVLFSFASKRDKIDRVQMPISR